MKDIYKQFGIYRITNKNNGKSYIGKTGTNFGDRWDCHRAQLNGGYHDNPHLQRAWNKYGADAFEFAIVQVVDDISQLAELEMKYIAEYRAVGKSYNLHDGGDGGYNLGKHLSDETKRLIGEKNRVHMTGRKHSEATKQKMSESHNKRYGGWSEEERAKWGKLTSQKASGYHWSDDARERFAQKQRISPNGARFTPDDIRRMRKMREDGARLIDIADEFGTSPAYVSSVVHRRRWKEI